MAAGVLRWRIGLIPGALKRITYRLATEDTRSKHGRSRGTHSGLISPERIGERSLRSSGRCDLAAREASQSREGANELEIGGIVCHRVTALLAATRGPN